MFKCKYRSVSVQEIFRKNPSQCFREKSQTKTRKTPKLHPSPCAARFGTASEESASAWLHANLGNARAYTRHTHLTPTHLTRRHLKPHQLILHIHSLIHSLSQSLTRSLIHSLLAVTRASCASTLTFPVAIANRNIYVHSRIAYLPASSIRIHSPTIIPLPLALYRQKLRIWCSCGVIWSFNSGHFMTITAHHLLRETAYGKIECPCMVRFNYVSFLGRFLLSALCLDPLEIVHL